MTKIPIVNQYSHVAYTRVLMPGRHEGLDLNEEVIEFLSVHIEYATVKEIYACKVLTQMLSNRTPGSMLQRLGQPDARAVATHEIESLLVLWSMAFFPSSEQMTFSFSWNDGRDPYLYGSTKVIDNVSYIKLNPLGCKTVAAYGALNANTMARLSTLLHELVHAFIRTFACKCHDTRFENLDNAGGHGVVWQRIANWVEHAAVEVLQVPLNLGRFMATQSQWDHLKAWPCPEEVRRWELKDR